MWFFLQVMTYITGKDKKMREIVREWNHAINPIGWAFAIWGVIYFFNFVFIIYASLPCSWVPKRSNDVIFGQIGFLFAVN